MCYNIFMKFIFFWVFLVLNLVIFFPRYIYAQTAETAIEKETRLRAELAQVEQEITAGMKILLDTQQQSSSLKRDILILDTKIKVAELNIKAKNLLIEGLGKDITKKEQTIGELLARIERGRESLGTTFEEIRSVKSQTENEKSVLDKRRNQEMDARQVIQQERKNIASNQAEKQRLLTVSKGNEKTYGAILAEKQRQAAQIRAALFALRDAQAIPFGDALAFANASSKVSGVRPAFLLAILTQESALGANVGSCYLTDEQTGAGANAKTGSVFPNVMKPGRDVEPFLIITKSLGLDSKKTLVSCPQSVGWGGAMGPAQFIPSTWMLFKDRIART